MSRSQHVYSFISGLVMLFLCVLLIEDPSSGLQIIAVLLSLTLLIRGLFIFIYYFAMARHMVGGKRILFMAVFLLDLGMFTINVLDLPRAYVVLYLLGYHAFSGIVNLMRGLEAKSYNSPEWRPNVVHGILDMLIAIVCLIFVRSISVLVFAYSITLGWSALLRIASVFRKTAVIYIGP